MRGRARRLLAAARVNRHMVALPPIDDLAKSLPLKR